MFVVNIKYVYLIKLHTNGVIMYGSKLKEIRNQLSVTQQEMADLLNISYRTYSSYERNENNPPYSMLVILCKNYKINLNWFIADEGNMIKEYIPNEFEVIKEKILLEVRTMLKNEGILKS